MTYGDSQRGQSARPSLRPIWFGPADRPLAGFLHEPVGTIRGGVVLCPPLGYEYTCSHRTLRTLAEKLADAGIVALRFDYEGTGASSGRGLDDDLLARWADNVRAAVDTVRGHGVARPAIFGLRIGAALALEVSATDHDLSALALWAPVASGKRYVRELRAQSAITPGGPQGDGSLNVMGNLVPAGMVTALRTWRPAVGVAPDVPLLVLSSAGWRGHDEAVAELRDCGLEPDVVELPGTSDILERDAEVAEVPTDIVNHAVTWLVRRCTATPSNAERSVADTGALDTSSVRSFDEGAGMLREEIVSFGRFGNYGVRTLPAADNPSTEAFVFLNNGVATASGPGRSWVQFARALAAEGTPSLRFDMTGLGDSPDTVQRAIRSENPAPKTAADQLEDAVALLRAEGATRVTAVGLCSGAQIAVRTSAHRPGIDRVYAINPKFFFPRDIGAGSPMRRFWHLLAWPMAKWKFRRQTYRLPLLLWVILDRLRLFPLPGRFLAQAAAAGTEVVVLFSAEDNGYEDLNARCPGAVERLAENGTIEVEVVEGMDHSMFSVRHRSLVLDRLRAGASLRETA